MWHNIKFYLLTVSTVVLLFTNPTFASKENAAQPSNGYVIHLRSPFDIIDTHFLFSDYYWNNIVNDRLYLRYSDSIKTNYLTQDKKYIITMEVPGYDKSQIKVKVNANKLYITCHTYNQKDASAVSSSKKNFDYTISLPDDVDQKTITSDLKNGILTITLPRIEVKEQNAKEIPIN